MTKPKDMSREEYNAINRAKRAASRDEVNAKRREYYRNNKEKLTAINRNWDKRNLEQKRAARRKWRKESGYIEYERKWFKENEEKRREYGRKSYHKNKERTKPMRAVRAKNRCALKRGGQGSFTYQDVDRLFNQQLGCCAGCARSFSDELPVTIDHVVPLSRGGSNLPDNIQLMCMSCNDSKGSRTMDEWCDYILEAA